MKKYFKGDDYRDFQKHLKTLDKKELQKMLKTYSNNGFSPKWVNAITVEISSRK